MNANYNLAAGAKRLEKVEPSLIRTILDRASALRAQGKNVIPFSAGEPDFDTPWHIRDEGIYSLEKGRTFYTSNAGLKDLKIEICNYLKRLIRMTMQETIFYFSFFVHNLSYSSLKFLSQVRVNYGRR